MEYVSLEGLRLDGRRPKETRQMRCAMGVLPAADGSAEFRAGNTRVMCAVHGPRECVNRGERDDERAIIKCEFSQAAFSTGERRARGKGDRRSVELALVIRQALEATVLVHLAPRSEINVMIQVLQADGGVRAAAINAAVLAIANAGIPMKDTMAACSAGYLDGTPLLDLNYVEEGGGGVRVHVATHACRGDKVVVVQTDNKASVEVFEPVHALAVEGCAVVQKVMREAMIEHTSILATLRGREAL